MMGILLPPNRFRRYSGIVVTWRPELSFCLPAALLPPLPKLRSTDGLPGILSGRLKREEKMGTKGWGEDELGFCEELCT